MTPEQQADAWWQELSLMMKGALDDLHYQAGNSNTLIIPGLTTIVGETP